MQADLDARLAGIEEPDDRMSHPADPDWGVRTASLIAFHATHPTAASAAWLVVLHPAFMFIDRDDPGGRKLLRPLLRDVFGNPFRPVALDRRWRTSTIRSLAQAAYDERDLPSGRLDPLRLSILADALEEASAAGEA
ncbi:MAG: hypothetical protein K2W96_00545, partial [Gemmataceae bacterium]|nr:hypothetical protein [Gemmataceae bacterium]